MERGTGASSDLPGRHPERSGGSGEGTPHALVIGGTGMLRGVVVHLAGEGWAVTVVARGRRGLDATVSAATGLPGVVTPVAVDYRDGAALCGALGAARVRGGPFSLAVCWIHGGHDGAPPIALEEVARELSEGWVSGSGGPRLVEVRGSATRDPSAPDPRRDALVARWPRVRHAVVILGFAFEEGRARWLADEEIVRGVVDAIRASRQRSVVGRVEPWSSRP
jgi:hypothetical protein